MLTPQAIAIENLFYIQDKTGVRVPFKLNESQAAFDAVRSRRKKRLITKARQKGFSAYILALFAIDCMGKEGTRAVVISHEGDATQRLLNRVHYYLKQIKGPKPVLGRHSRNELYFPKTESTFYIGTAGSRAFGRGDTITHLHVSEYAWWGQDSVKHVAGLWQAVPKTGEIYVESTGNGRSNDFYEMFLNHDALGFLHFHRSWWEDSEYSLPAPEGWFIDSPWVEHRHIPHLLELKEKLPQLQDNQLFWYYQKLLEFRGNINTMRQEYPSNPIECFQATGGSIFPEIHRTESLDWISGFLMDVYCSRHQQHPREGYHYILGADPSGGTGNDDASIQVFCVETMEQVYQYIDNRTNPVRLGHLISQVGQHYNEAYAVVEANNHGISTLAVLREIYPKMSIFKRAVPLHGPPKYGWQTSELTKPQLTGLFNELLEEGITIYSKELQQALEAFEESTEGRMEGKGDHQVIAACLCGLGLRKQELFRHVQPTIIIDPKEEALRMANSNMMTTSYEEIFKNLKSKGQRGGTGRFKPQAWSVYG
jgi:hypothetical protein